MSQHRGWWILFFSKSSCLVISINAPPSGWFSFKSIINLSFWHIWIYSIPNYVQYHEHGRWWQSCPFHGNWVNKWMVDDKFFCFYLLNLFLDFPYTLLPLLWPIEHLFVMRDSHHFFYVARLDWKVSMDVAQVSYVGLWCLNDY
jgi:hypothetical protein